MEQVDILYNELENYNFEKIFIFFQVIPGFLGIWNGDTHVHFSKMIQLIKVKCMYLLFFSLFSWWVQHKDVWTGQYPIYWKESNSTKDFLISR